MKDKLDALEQLKALLDRGALTQAEFEEQKAKILGGGKFSPMSWRVILLALLATAAVGFIWWFARDLGEPKDTGKPAAAKATEAPEEKAVSPPPAPEPVDPYAGAIQTGCRQDVCSWEKLLAVRTVRRTSRGTLKVEETYQGTIVHRDGSYAETYSSALPIEWEKAPVQTYVFCSTQQPSTAFKDRWEGGSGRWIGHLLNLYETYGYNTPSAQTYMRVCHGIDFHRRDIDKVLSRLGYRPGTRDEQVDLARPTDLPNPPPPEEADAAGANE